MTIITTNQSGRSVGTRPRRIETKNLRTVLVGKLMVRAGLPMLFTLATVFAGLIFIGDGLSGVGGALSVLALTIIYGLFWAALAAAVNGLGRDSAYNALMLVGAWVVVLLIVPSLTNAATEALYPSPSRVEMVLGVRAASVSADKERDAVLARYEEEHLHGTGDGNHEEVLTRGSARERTLRRLAVQQAATARAEEVLAVHEAQLQRQHDLAERLAYISPALLANDAIAEIAGTGRSRYDEFFTQVDRFHQEWREFFVSRAQAERMLSSDDYGRFPRFQFIEHPDSGADTRVATALAGIAVPLLLLAVAASFGLRRCRVVN